MNFNKEEDRPDITVIQEVPQPYEYWYAINPREFALREIIIYKSVSVYWLMAFNYDSLKIYSEISKSMAEAEEKFLKKFKKRPLLKPQSIQWTQSNSVQYLLSLMVNIPVMSECKI